MLIPFGHVPLLLRGQATTPIRQRFPIPNDDDDFEEMCVQLLRKYWSRPRLEVFGKRGERQYGIDVLDLGGEKSIYAAQCKLKEEHKSLSPSEIQAEVDQAKLFNPPLSRYAILTTAKISAHSQRKIREINQSHKDLGLFEVELFTWDDLCPLLQQYSEIQEQFYSDIVPRRARRMEAQLVAINEGLQSLTSRGGENEIDSQINDARDCISKREFQLATLLLNRVQRTSDDKLTPYQRFRVLSNLAAAALGSGKTGIAAKLFLEARTHEPNTELGKINEVLAYLLAGDPNSCYEKASVLRKEYPGSARLAALWLTSAPKEISLSVLESEINSVLLTDAEVCAALARRAVMALALDKALEYADSANKLAPAWSQPHLIRAQALLGSALHIQFGFRGTTAPQENSLLEAEEECSKALETAQLEKDEQTEKMALVLRVDIRLMLKKKDEAIKDAADAERLDPQDPQIMLAMAEAYIASDRREDAISILERAFRLTGDPSIAFVLGRSLYNRGRETDIDQAIRVMRQVSIQDIRPELRPTYATQTFQCLTKAQDWTAAETYLAEVSPFLDPVLPPVFRGYLAHFQERPEQAEAHATEARSLLAANTNPDTEDYLARLFMLIGRPADALPLWRNLFDTKAPAFDPGNLLNCAARLHKDDVVMQTCEELHARGVNDWQLLEFEISYLEKYRIDTAIQRVQAFIALHPEHKLAKLRLSLIGLGINRLDLVDGSLQSIPSTTDLPIDYVIPAIQVMKYGGNPNEAVDFAYHSLRENFNELQAHQALIVSMLPGPATPDIPPTLEVVGSNAAVCYQEFPQGIETWVVLEDTEKPNGDFEEISLTSPLAGELLNKRVGDTVVIARGTLQDRTATIVRIVPKYVRRYQDSTGEMQVRFGPASTVESIRIPTDLEKNPEEGLKVILESVEKRAAALADARSIYSSLPASLHWYGTCFGKNAYVALMDLAREEGQQIKCSFGTAEEREPAVKALQTAKVVIIDITALATLRLLGLEHILSCSRFRFVISERTWVAFQEMLFNDRIFSAPGGTLMYRDGQHFMLQESAEEKEQRNQNNEEFIRFLEKTVEIRSAPALAALEHEKRESLRKFFGPYGAESILLASDPESILWTDDLIQAQMSAQEFGVRRVWSQLVLGFLTDSGLLTPRDYSEATANLVGMEFVATLFDSSSTLAAVRLAEWSFKRRPAAQFLKIFADPAADLQRLLRIFVEFTINLYREPVTPETRDSLTRTLLDTFAMRSESMVLLSSFRKVSSRIFGINQVGKAQFEECYDNWLTRRDKPIIYLR